VIGFLSSQFAKKFVKRSHLEQYASAISFPHWRQTTNTIVLGCSRKIHPSSWQLLQPYKIGNFSASHRMNGPSKLLRASGLPSLILIMYIETARNILHVESGRYKRITWEKLPYLEI
jgi:hypothetical protein